MQAPAGTMAGVSNLWGQPRPETVPTPAPDEAAGAEIAPDPDAEVGLETESDLEIEAEGEPGAEPVIETGPEPVIQIEPVATRDDLPTMAQLDALSAELDEIDAALAAMDADPSLPGRASAQNPQRA